MFEELFKKPHTVQRCRAAPLVEPRERYLRHLAESGARRLTLRQIALDQVRLLHLLDLREGGKIAVAQIEAIAPKWDRTRHHKLGHRPRTSRKSLNSTMCLALAGLPVAKIAKALLCGGHGQLPWQECGSASHPRIKGLRDQYFGIPPLELN